MKYRIIPWTEDGTAESDVAPVAFTAGGLVVVEAARVAGTWYFGRDGWEVPQEDGSTLYGLCYFDPATDERVYDVFATPEDRLKLTKGRRVAAPGTMVRR